LSNWNAVIVPGRTPRPIVERLFVAINKALQAPELRKRQQGAGIEPLGSSSQQEFAQFVRDDSARWAKIVKETGITVE